MNIQSLVFKSLILAVGLIVYDKTVKAPLTAMLARK